MSTICIALEDEGTVVWRPVAARELGDGLYEIPPEALQPEDEQWQFRPGDWVRCEWRSLSGGPALVAVERIDRAG